MNEVAAVPDSPKQEQKNIQSNMGAEKLEIIASRGFAAWLLEQKISLAFTTYQAGKIVLVGFNIKGDLALSEQSISRCMGLAADKTGRNIYMSGHYSIFLFSNIVSENQKPVVLPVNDSVYVPQGTFTTGDIDVHDMAVLPSGELLFVSSLYSCVAALSLTHSFVPVWKPKFISKLMPEDRCHLNGFCLDQYGHPAYATAVAETDKSEAWRDHRNDGGIVIDILTDEIIARGLSMPHSPRLYNGKLYVHEAGSGYFGTVDPDTGKFEKIAFLPGFLRGLSFSGNYAIAGISKARKEKNFKGLELDENLKKHNAEPRCGIYVIDLLNGTLVHSLQFEGFLEEIYDTQVLPEILRPTIVAIQGENIRKMHSIGNNCNRLHF